MKKTVKEEKVKSAICPACGSKHWNRIFKLGDKINKKLKLTETELLNLTVGTTTSSNMKMITITGDEGNYYWECSKCGKACDPITTKPKMREWEKEFEKRFNKEVVVMGDYLFSDLKAFIRSLLSAKEVEVREEIKAELENLISEASTKDLSDSLETVYGERKCKICGCEPERQREMILRSLNPKKERR